MHNKARLLAVLMGLISCSALVTHAVTVTVDYSTVVRVLPPDFHGLNYCTFWDDRIGKDSSTQALRRSGVQLLRYPGGEPANYFDWSVTPTNASNSVTIDKIGPQAKAIGARILYQTNPSTGDTVNSAGKLDDPSGKHQKDLVNYCKANNIDVALWEIGNEPDMHGSFNAINWYYSAFNQQADSIHAADPNAVVMGPAEFSALDDSGWIRTFETNCGTHANAVSIHWYPSGDPAAPGWTDSVMLQEAEQWTNSAWPMLTALTKKPVYVTEWSLDKNPSWYHVGLKMYLSVSHADVIGAFAKTGVAGHTLFGSIHCITDSWGILASDGCGDGYVNGTLAKGTLHPETPAPDYFMFNLWTKMGQTVLNATHDANASYVFNAWAHKKSDGSVQVMLINKDTLHTQSVTVKFTGFDPTGKQVDVYELYKSKDFASDRLDSVMYNGMPHPYPATSDLPGPINGGICAASTFTRTVPALSITVLNFRIPGSVLNPVRGAGIDLSKLKNETVAVYDVRGRRLAEGMTRRSTTGAAGVYFLTAKGSGSARQTPVVVNRW